jgi:hypothetical protein
MHSLGFWEAPTNARIADGALGVQISRVFGSGRKDGHTFFVDVVGFFVAQIFRPPRRHERLTCRASLLATGGLSIGVGCRVREFGLLLGFDSLDPVLQDDLAGGLLQVAEPVGQELGDLFFVVQTEAG